MMRLRDSASSRSNAKSRNARISIFVLAAISVSGIVYTVQKSELRTREVCLVQEIKNEVDGTGVNITDEQKKRAHDEWAALADSLTNNNLLLEKPHLDISKPNFIGDDVLERAKKDKKLEHDIAKFLEIREAALNEQSEAKAEGHLIWHIKRSIVAMKEAREIYKEKQELPKTVLLIGGILFVCLEAIYQLIKLPGRMRNLFQKLSGQIKGFIRRKTWIPYIERREEERQRRLDEKRRQREATGSQTPSIDNKTVMKRGTITSRMELAEPAREVLSEKIGDRACEIILEVLGDKISSRVMRGIISGNYHGLISILRNSRMALEAHEFRVDEVITLLRGETGASSPTKEIDTIPAPTRKKHPLDDAERWGWRPAAFHRLLIRYGFDTSEPTGGGHFFVKFEGEKVRELDGRAVLVTSRSSTKEVTPGLAGNILKACADFLVAKDTKERRTDISKH